MTYIILLNLYKSGSLPEYEQYFINCISFSFSCQVKSIKILKSRLKYGFCGCFSALNDEYGEKTDSVKNEVGCKNLPAPSVISAALFVI